MGASRSVAPLVIATIVVGTTPALYASARPPTAPPVFSTATILTAADNACAGEQADWSGFGGIFDYVNPWAVGDDGFDYVNPWALLVAALPPALGTAFSEVLGGASWATALTHAGQHIADAVGGTLGPVIQTGLSTLGKVISIASTISDGIMSIAAAIPSAALNVATALVAAATRVIGSLGGDISGAIAEGIDGVNTAITQSVDTLKTVVETTIAEVKTVLGNGAADQPATPAAEAAPPAPKALESDDSESATDGDNPLAGKTAGASGSHDGNASTGRAPVAKAHAGKAPRAAHHRGTSSTGTAASAKSDATHHTGSKRTRATT